MFKRFLMLCFVVLLCVGMCSCSTKTAENNMETEEDEKTTKIRSDIITGTYDVYELFPGMSGDGFSLESSHCSYDYRHDDDLIRLELYDRNGPFPDVYKSIGYEKRTENGIEYWYLKETYSVEAVDSKYSGEQTDGSLYFYCEDYIVALTVMSNDQETPFLTLDIAQKLLRGETVSGLVPDGKNAWARFSDGFYWITATHWSEESEYRNYVDASSAYLEKEEEGLKYLLCYDETDLKAMIAKTDKGYIRLLWYGVEDGHSDDMDFMNVDMLRKVADHLGLKLAELPNL